MNIKKLSKEQIPDLNPYKPVKLTDMGDVKEIQSMDKFNHKQTIQLLKGGEQYKVCSTGEIKDVTHHDKRKDNPKSLYKTFAVAKELINTNATDVKKIRWCVLTYAECMTDTKQLYQDFQKFNQRFQYYCTRHGYEKPEYIAMMEPQGRGAWHIHLLYIWEKMDAPYIANDIFEKIWSHGFVSIKKLDNISNIANYLTGYAMDIEASELDENQIVGKSYKVVDVEENGQCDKKNIIKGGRLGLYPTGFNILRHSRGIKKPIKKYLSVEEAYEELEGYTMISERGIKITDPNSNFENTIIKQLYKKAYEPDFYEESI